MTETEKNESPARAFGRQLEDFWLEGGEGIADPHKPPRYDETQRLHPAEWKLLACAASGEVCVLGDERPNRATAETRIRASLLRFIALGGDKPHPLHDHGVQLVGAFVEGVLDFRGSVVPENLIFFRSTFYSDVNFLDCCAETVAFRACKLKGLQGDRMETTGSLYADYGSIVQEVFALIGAKIGGVLNCSGSRFEGGDVSLECDGVETAGSVFLRGDFTARGTVRLLGAKIGGNLYCEGSRFEGGDVSLHCDRLEAKGGVFLRNGFTAQGMVRLLGAKIGGYLDCRNGKFLAPKDCLDAEGASIEGAAFLDHGFLALGTVSLANMKVGTDLRFTNGTFSAAEKAIYAPNVKVGNSIYLNSECRVRGEVSFQSAVVGDSVTFEGGSFETKGQINLRNAKIGNMLTWRGVNYVRGELNLAGVSCKSLNMDEKAWSQPSQIRLDSFAFERFAELPDGCDPAFWKRWLEKQPERHLNSRFRPNPYQQLAKVLTDMGHEEEARSVRIEHRERQRLFTRDYVKKPLGSFNWLIRVLADFWRLVEKYVTAHGYRPGYAAFWLVGLVAAGTLVYYTAALHGIMTPTHPLIFKEAIWNGDIKDMPPGKIPQACRENWVYPPDDIKDVCAAAVASEYSTFSALIYSLDTAIPVVNFRMENDWSPRVVDWQTGDTGDWRNPWTWQAGWWVRTWEWVQIGLGWAFSLLFVSAISGVIRRD